MEEWKKLTTVNYPHGMGGNFFSCLITNTPVKMSEGLTVDYYSPGVLNKFGLKTVDIQVGCALFDEYKKYWLEEGQDDEFTQRQVKFRKLVEAPTFDEIKKNLIDTYRDYLKHCIGIETVWSPHYAYGNQKYLSCQEIFPESRNICLLIENQENAPAYDFIFRSKAAEHWKHPRIYNFFKHRELQSGEGETVYYLDRILFERGFSYLRRIEDELKVKINMEDAEMYKRAHADWLHRNNVHYVPYD